MSEITQVTNDPNFAVEFAVGEPFPELVEQDKSDGIKVCGVYFPQPKRYVLKSAHLSKDDNRMLDKDTGKIVMVSHHPGKNPYEGFDPLGLNDDSKYDHKPTGGEWECVCDVSSKRPFKSFRIRPKAFTRHGRQYIKMNKDDVVMNIGKMGKLKSQSLRPHFVVGRGDDKDPVYTLVSDMMGRTIGIRNEREELVAQITKTTKALIQTAVLGSGTESTVDIAPGVDCSTILMIVFGLGQVGEHYVNDAFGNYVADPLKDSAVDAAAEATGTQEAVSGYQKLSSSMQKKTLELQKQAQAFQKFFN